MRITFWCSVLAMVAVYSLIDAEIVVMRAVRNMDAKIPCGQGKVFLDGPDAYVLWLKNDRDVMHRFPNEDFDTGLVTDHMFGSACVNGMCRDETVLHLKHVGEQDVGTYTCRVHYQASPSVDFVMELKLVESPGIPKIMNESRQLISSGRVGPITLGDNLTFICEVLDNDLDQPETIVHWRRNGAIVEHAEAAGQGILRAEIHIKNATRDELNAHYECQAQNADVTEPLTSSVVVEMYLPPLSVEIRVNHNNDFEASQPRVVDCVVVGCVPAPSITWYLGDTMLRPTVHKELHDGNYTVSSLTLTPALRENKKDLICRAHNSHMPKVMFENKIRINVGYRPRCLNDRQETIGAVDGEVETVTCLVEASPEPMQFTWTFADSRTVFTAVKKVNGHPHEYISTLSWKPRDGDLGQLFCRATNAFGEQKRPCSFIISPGGPPNLPECIVIRAHHNAVRVQCRKGWNGGRPQMLHLEIATEEGDVLKNVSEPNGHFFVSGIRDDMNLTANVYASNARGRSKVRIMQLPSMGPQTAPVSDDDDGVPTWTRWVEAIAAGIAIAVAVASAAVCIKAFRTREEFQDFSPDLVPRPDGVFHREPDFAREERPVLPPVVPSGTTNITVNQLATCQNVSDQSNTALLRCPNAALLWDAQGTPLLPPPVQQLSTPTSCKPLTVMAPNFAGSVNV